MLTISRMREATHPCNGAVAARGNRLMMPAAVAPAKKKTRYEMMSVWWFFWLIGMFFFLAAPIGYGWGYRGWGPPYPRYFQRLRAQRAAASGGSESFNHHAWGWGGDLVWIVLLIEIIWVAMVFLWR